MALSVPTEVVMMFSVPSAIAATTELCLRHVLTWMTAQILQLRITHRSTHKGKVHSASRQEGESGQEGEPKILQVMSPNMLAPKIHVKK